MTHSSAQLQCPFTNGEAPKVPPSIEATGRETQEQFPDKGQLLVQINGEAFDREEAWMNFQALADQLRSILGPTATVGTIEPVQDSKMVSVTLRSDREVFCVSADVVVYFDLPNFGDVIAALVENHFTYSDILFTYSDKFEVTPELLEAAGKDARDRAEAVARGVGKSIGRLVSVHIGEADRQTLRGLEPIWDNVVYSKNSSVHLSEFKIDRSLFDVRMSDLKTRVVTAHVTARFEIVE